MGRNLETMGDFFLEAAARDQGEVGFWHNSGQVTTYRYEALVQGALRVAGALQARGIAPGERVAIVLPTGPDFYHAFFGIILAGGVPSALYPPVRLGRIDEWKRQTTRMLDALAARFVLTAVNLYALLGQPAKDAKLPTQCLLVHGLLNEGRAGTYSGGLSHELAFVQFSSGSTGNPKPVALTHAQVLSNTKSILARLPGLPGEKSCVSWLPLYHDMGLVGCLIAAVVENGKLTLINPEVFVGRPRVWLEALSRTRSSITVAPNFSYSLCADRIQPDQLEGL